MEHAINQNQTIIADTTSNPAPLGLLGFGITTILLNLHNAGLFELGSMILAMGIFYGGIGQIIAGIMEWKKGNTFGTTAFTSYGLFWLTLTALLIMPKLGIAEKNSNLGMASYLIMWGIFTFFMFLGTLKMNYTIMFIFGSLTILFFLLAIGDIFNSGMIKKIAGIEGIICGASAVYSAVAQILNEVYKKNLFPLGIK